MMTTTRRRAPVASKPVNGLLVLLASLAVAACGISSPAATGGTETSTALGPSPTTMTRTAEPSGPAATEPAVPAGPQARSAPRTSASIEPAAPSATPRAAAPTPDGRLTSLKMNLYRRGDFVAQYTFEWCVGASLQMALNMTTADDHTSRASQEQLWEMAQARSSSPFGGANPRGWTAALNELGIGPYELVSVPDFDGAVRLAAAAIRETQRPVGLVMWRGRHAWVMSGFESMGDPAVHRDARITGIRVLDPLYPHGSAVWGPSPKPNSLVTPATLAKQFVIRDHGRVDLGVPPGFLLVLPTNETVDTLTD